MPDVVERVRVLVEGTTQSEAAIAAQVGISSGTVMQWKLRRCWTRPAAASRSTRKVGVHRAGFSRRVREALARVEALASREIERLERQEPPDDAVLARALAISTRARARTAAPPPHQCADAVSFARAPVRLTLRPLGGQGQPYDDDVVARARELAERTIVTHKEIAARIGVSKSTIGHWARAGRWRRPFGAARAVDETGQSWSALERHGTRITPWRRLDEAERLLDALEREGGGGLDGVERALVLLLEARAAMPILRRPRCDGALRASRRTAARRSSA